MKAVGLKQKVCTIQNQLFDLVVKVTVTSFLYITLHYVLIHIQMYIQNMKALGLQTKKKVLNWRRLSLQRGDKITLCNQYILPAMKQLLMVGGDIKIKFKISMLNKDKYC